MCKQESDLSIVGGSLRVSLMIDSGSPWYLGTTLGHTHWWEFVHTECRRDVIITLHHSNGPACCV